MHSLETIHRLNLAAAERELATKYGREHARHDTVRSRWRVGKVPTGAWRSPDRLRTLRARLLALGAALLAISCGSPTGPRIPDISDPLPPPPDAGPAHRPGPRAYTLTLDNGAPLLVIQYRD